MTATIIAKRPGQWLVQTGEQKGYVLDRDGEHPVPSLHSALARGYWKPCGDSLDVVKRQLEHDAGSRE